MVINVKCTNAIVKAIDKEFYGNLQIWEQIEKKIRKSIAYATAEEKMKSNKPHEFFPRIRRRYPSSPHLVDHEFLMIQNGWLFSVTINFNNLASLNVK